MYLQRKRKPVYVAFINFKKAFDSVNRSILYKVLRKNNVKGLLFESIQAIYKYKVRTNNCISDMFDCPVG